MTDTVVSIFAILATLATATWQVNRQFKNNRKLQKQVERNKIWLEIFREINEKRNGLLNAKIAATSFAESVLRELDNAANAPELGMHANLKTRRSQQFLDLKSDLSHAIADLVILIEQYEIIQPSLSIFRTAFFAIQYDLEAVGMDLFQEYLQALPIELNEITALGVETQLIEHSARSADQLKKLTALTKSYESYGWELLGYNHDLGVEIQNLLLGDLFDHRVPVRKPIDPQIVVVSTASDQLAKLEAHFEGNTNWGRSNIDATESALRALEE